MSIVEQISRGLTGFTNGYVMKKRDAILHTFVEVRMCSALEATMRAQHDAEQWSRFEADFDKNAPFTTAPPMPNLRQFTHVLGCPLVIDDTLPLHCVRFSYDGVTSEIQITA